MVLVGGTYLTGAIVSDDRVVGLAIGGHTGFVPFCEVPQAQGRSGAHWLQLRPPAVSLLAFASLSLGIGFAGAGPSASASNRNIPIGFRAFEIACLPPAR
jgi:hypothetical protein